MAEASMHDRTSFLTLTFKDSKRPHKLSVDRKHVTEFVKAHRNHLRNLHPDYRTFRYFAVGEYGEETGREHYHLAVFGQDYIYNRRFLQKNKQGDTLYTSPTLTKLWPYGHHSIGELSPTSARYVAGYMLQKIRGLEAFEKYGAEIDYETGEILSTQQTPPFSQC